MKQKAINSLYKLKTVFSQKSLAFLFLFTIFFPMRKVFLSQNSFRLGQYSDFTTISLYLSDLLLLGLIFSLLWVSKNLQKPTKSQLMQTSIAGMLIIWLIISTILHKQTITGLDRFFIAKFIELIVAYGTVQLVFQNKPLKHWFYQAFAVFGTIQSVIALYQFKLQRPLGLFWLGEQHLSVYQPGFAKLVVAGHTYLRGYGTFPHPNLLSAFLVVSVIITTYLYLNSEKTKQKVLYGTYLFLNILGLIATFSRAGFIALGTGLIVYFGYLVITNRLAKQVTVGIWVILVSLFIGFGIFKPFISARSTVVDNSSQERVVYAKAGWKMIGDHPWFGVGIGESVLHMKQYAEFALEPWQIQPIHNYFLLATSELGIPGAIILIWLFAYYLWKLTKNIKQLPSSETSDDNLLLATIIICFLILMQFDHYFYTLQQTQLLLWVFLGLAATKVSSETKNPIQIGKG